MKNRHAFCAGRLGLPLLCALLLAGCFTYTPRVDTMADRLERDLPGASLERGHGAKLGRLSLGLARAVAGAAIDDDEDPEAAAGLRIARGIKRVEFRQFTIDGAVSEEWSPSRLERRLESRGWDTVARVVGDESLAWVLVRFDDRHVRSAIVLALDGEELALLRLSGRLDRVIAEAIRFARSEVHEDDWHDEWEEAPDAEEWDEIESSGTVAEASGATTVF
ncbi:MAG: hypothetical protein DWQ36_13540 [Acidobacteria bacterium]|nr:MAG: hypothetical protein DWQ30_12010 [Acidobacteriota bacterium]REK06234.1 MAG: hypothetical protein DWQ36_13540 [Acidobacteriota bacterium]